MEEYFLDQELLEFTYRQTLTRENDEYLFDAAIMEDRDSLDVLCRLTLALEGILLGVFEDVENRSSYSEYRVIFFTLVKLRLYYLSLLDELKNDELVRQFIVAEIRESMFNIWKFEIRKRRLYKDILKPSEEKRFLRISDFDLDLRKLLDEILDPEPLS